MSIATWTDTYSKHYADGFKSDIENEAYCLQLIEKYDVLLSNGVIHAHPVCGVTCGHTTKHERLYWTGISDLSEITDPENTYYYLTDNVEVSSTWTPKDGTVLDLNGKNITATSGGAVIKVEDGVDFTLTDCKADNGTYDTTFTYGQITHKSGCEGKGIDVQSGGTFTMYGGDITKNGSQSTSPISSTIGCGVSVNGGTFYMYDGTINNNTMCVNEHGGGVDMTGGLFEMYGGKITYNTSASTSSGHGGAAASGNYVIVAFTDGKLTVSARPSSGGGGGGRTPTYPVTTPSGVDSSKKSAAKGDVVTITVKPEAGYVVKEVLVTDAKGNQIKVTAKGNSVFTFVQPDSQVDIQAVYTRESTPFQDVTWSDYFYDAVTWAKDNNVTGGVGNDLFGADRSCTRAQIVTFLWRAAGSPEPKGAANMTDVPQDAYYAKAVAWAIENGITSGTGENRFSPDATCTRAQGVTFLYRAAGSPAVTGSAGFQDVSGSDYFAAAVAWAKANDITDGVGNGLFGSKNSCTRAQIVTFLYLSQQA